MFDPPALSAQSRRRLADVPGAVPKAEHRPGQPANLPLAGGPARKVAVMKWHSRASALFKLAAVLAVLFLGTVVARAQGPSDPRPTAVARITCQLNGPGVLHATVVRAHRDGVHFIAVNRTREEEWFTGGSSYRGWVIEPGQTRRIVTDARPGVVGARCGEDPTADAPDDSPTMLVVDPHGYWRRWGIQCEGNIWWAWDDLTASRVPPIRQAAQQIGGRLPGDSLSRGGYPAGVVQEISLSRRHRIIMRITYRELRGHKWVPYDASWCLFANLSMPT